MKIIVEADGDGFLAKINDNLLDTFAWGKTKKEALSDLFLVVESIIEIHRDEIEKGEEAKKMLLDQNFSYAV